MPSRTSCIRNRLLKICSILPNNAYSQRREREREREHTYMYTCKAFYTMNSRQSCRNTHRLVHSHNSQFDLAHSTPLHCYTSHFTNKCWEYLSPHMDAMWRERSDRQRQNITLQNGWIPSHTVFAHVYMHVHVLTMATCNTCTCMYMYMYKLPIIWMPIASCTQNG